MSCKILHWNACGIQHRLAELKMRIVDVNYDIICLQETMLRKTSKFQLKLPGYSTIRKDVADAAWISGGLATLVRDSLSYTILDSPGKIESLVVRVAMIQSSYLTVANVYLPPVKSGRDEPNVAEFSRLFDHNNCVVVGDLNARNQLWGSPMADRRGYMIESVVEDEDFFVINSGQPTHYWHVGEPSHIDVSLASKCLATRSTWSVVENRMGSDHTPVEITLNIRPEYKTTSLPKWKYTKRTGTPFALLAPPY